MTNGGNLALNISVVNMTGPDVAQFRFTGSNTVANCADRASGRQLHHECCIRAANNGAIQRDHRIHG